MQEGRKGRDMGSPQKEKRPRIKTMGRVFGKIVFNLKTLPFFWLLPLFFVLKNVRLYFGAIPFLQVCLLLVLYWFSATIIFLVLRFFLKLDACKSGLLVLIMLVLYFFYDSIDTWIQSQLWLHPLNRYRYSLTFILLLAAAGIFFTVRARIIPSRTILYFNLLLLLFCLWEGTGIVSRALQFPEKSIGVSADPSLATLHGFQGRKPTIYFLLFDEYQGNQGLHTLFGFDNEILRGSMARRGFFCPSRARSNYNYTFFSLPSILNMNYLQGEIQGSSDAENILNFSAAVRLMNNSNILQILRQNGYSILNLSPFRITDTGQRISKYRPIVMEKDLLTRQTFFSLWTEKAGWLIRSRRLLRWLNPEDYDLQFYNKELRDSVCSLVHDGDPRFIYAHFFVPHPPFLLDSAGRQVDFREYTEKRYQSDTLYMKTHYLDYVKYANGFCTQMIDSILQKDSSSIIIMMSDHGFRGLKPAGNPWLFDIQFYVRTPELNYSQWPDTVDAVNVFRLLFRNEFQEELTPLPYHSREFHETR
jgi:hypothetical protein